MKTRTLRSVTLLLDRQFVDAVNAVGYRYQMPFSRLAETAIVRYVGNVLLRTNALADAPWPEPATEVA